MDFWSVNVIYEFWNHHGSVKCVSFSILNASGNGCVSVYKNVNVNDVLNVIEYVNVAVWNVKVYGFDYEYDCDYGFANEIGCAWSNDVYVNGSACRSDYVSDFCKIKYNII